MWAQPVFVKSQPTLIQVWKMSQGLRKEHIQPGSLQTRGELDLGLGGCTRV